MSWQKSLLNPLLRLIEKRQMANAEGPSSMRRSFELKAEKVILYCDGDRCKHTVSDGVLTEQPWAVRFEFRAVCPKPLKTIKVG